MKPDKWIPSLGDLVLIEQPVTDDENYDQHSFSVYGYHGNVISHNYYVGTVIRITKTGQVRIMIPMLGRNETSFNVKKRCPSEQISDREIYRTKIVESCKPDEVKELLITRRSGGNIKRADAAANATGVTFFDWKDTLSGRTFNVLGNAGIDSWEALMRVSPSRLLKVKNCGPSTIAEIMESLGQYGLDLPEVAPSEIGKCGRCGYVFNYCPKCGHI